MFRIDMAAAVCLLALATPSRADTGVQPPAAPLDRVASYGGASEYRLANGLRVVLVRDSASSVLTTAVVYLSGTAVEGPGQFGMAHLMEHVMFTGTEKHPDLLAEFGRRGAHPNATTAHDRTMFYETLPWNTDNLAWTLEIESDRLANIRITPATVAKERAAVRQEMAVTGADPQRRLFEAVMAAAFQWHGYGRSPVGTASDLEAITPEALQQFQRAHYRPSNAVLIVAGPLDEAATLSAVRERFESQAGHSLGAASDAPAGPLTIEPPQAGERTTMVRAARAVPTITIAFHVPPASHPDLPAIEVLAELLAGQEGLVKASPGSWRELRYELNRMRDSSVLLFTSPLTGEDPEAAARDLAQRLNRALDAPMTEEAIRGARQRRVNAFAASVRSASALALDLAEWAAAGDWRLRFAYRDGLERVDVTSMQAARRYLRPENLTRALLLPAGNDGGPVAIPPPPPLADRIARYDDRNGRSAAMHADASVVEGALQGGLKYALRNTVTADGSAALQLFLHFGSAESLRGLRATGEIAARAVANRLRAGPAAKELTALGVTAAASGTPSSLFVSLTAPGARLPDALAIVARALREPLVDEQAIERAREDVAAVLRMTGDDMSSEAQRVLAQSLAQWPPDHVLYAPPAKEAISALAAVTPADVTRFFRRFYGAGAGELVASGPLEAAAVVQSMEHALGDWRSDVAFERMPLPAAVSRGTMTRLTWPGAAGAVVMAGIPIPIDDTHPDYAAVLVANQLLGGGFYGALLPKIIRGESGAAYRVASIVHANAWGDETRSFQLTVMCAADQSTRVIDLTRKVLADVRSSARPDDEIAAAREGLLQASSLARGRDSTWLSATVHALFKGRPVDAEAQMDEAIARVTPADVQRVLQRYFDPERVVFVVAGG